MNSAGQGLPGDPYGDKPDIQLGCPAFTKKTTDKLKPCPFCGRKAEKRFESGPNDYGHYIGCPKCGYWMEGILDEEGLIKRWNKRAYE